MNARRGLFEEGEQTPRTSFFPRFHVVSSLFDNLDEDTVLNLLKVVLGNELVSMYDLWKPSEIKPA